MREEDIFGENEFETFDTFLDNRFSFALARKCRLYRYDKLIGINFSVYADKIDQDSIIELPFIGTKETDFMMEDDIYLSVVVEAYDYTNNKFVGIGKYNFPLRSKSWSTNELKVKSDFINDDSEFSIQFQYGLYRSSFRNTGFLKKKMVVDFFGVENPKVYSLTTVISKTNERTFENNDNDDVDDRLERLLEERGIK